MLSELQADILYACAARLTPGWDIEVIERPPEAIADDPPAACILWEDHLFTARIWFSPGTLNEPEEEFRAVVLHELAHLLFRDLRMEFMPYTKGRRKRDRWEHMEELIVERIGRAFGDLDI